MQIVTKLSVISCCRKCQLLSRAYQEKFIPLWLNFPISFIWVKFLMLTLLQIKNLNLVWKRFKIAFKEKNYIVHCNQCEHINSVTTLISASLIYVEAFLVKTLISVTINVWNLYSCDLTLSLSDDNTKRRRVIKLVGCIAIVNHM